ncbi:MAG: repeat containing protein [Verrucomicrobiales bacterium]|nr:repeat containing protein [Verrucomicrobiales bacterium]
MKRRSFPLFLFIICLFAFPQRSPAPLVYTPGEGWVYEQVGGGKWARTRAKDQLAVAQEAFDKKDFSLALKASRRTVKQWPLSDFAPQAQYLVGRCYEAKSMDEKAFKEYQILLEKYPKIGNYDEVLQHQYDIANRFLAGQRFKLWGYVPFFPSMDKTSDMYTKIVKNGPFSEVAPKAQMSLGAAREKQKNFPEAVLAYEQAADRYNDRKAISADALFKAALAYQKQATSSEYNQNVASQAVATYSDFITLYPEDPRVADSQKSIATLKTEQAKGSFRIAKYYEKHKRFSGALIYYNEVLLKDPDSAIATESRQRIEAIKGQVTPAAPSTAATGATP